MNLQAPHLFKSRHGIWYVRIVVPMTLSSIDFNRASTATIRGAFEALRADARCCGPRGWSIQRSTAVD
jgi:hypothetical protein